MVREGKDKNKFLLGHDERHWFAAAVPGNAVRDVWTAMKACGLWRSAVRR